MRYRGIVRRKGDVSSDEVFCSWRLLLGSAIVGVLRLVNDSGLPRDACMLSSLNVVMEIGGLRLRQCKAYSRAAGYRRGYSHLRMSVHVVSCTVSAVYLIASPAEG